PAGLHPVRDGEGFFGCVGHVEPRLAVACQSIAHLGRIRANIHVQRAAANECCCIVASEYKPPRMNFAAPVDTVTPPPCSVPSVSSVDNDPSPGQGAFGARHAAPPLVETGGCVERAPQRLEQRLGLVMV